MKNVIIATLAIATIVLFGLYLVAKDRPPEVVERTVTVEKRVEVPKEVIKEVLVEKIVEKPVPFAVEVIKEVPAKLPAEYESAMAVYKNVEDGFKNFVDSDGILKGIPDFKVKVVVGDVLKGVLDQDRLKTKIEISLRRNRIAINEKSSYELLYSIEAISVKRMGGFDAGLFSNLTSLSVSQYVIVPRNGGWLTTIKGIYEQQYFGVIPLSQINSIIEDAGNHIDKFSNNYLAANPRR